MHTRSKRIFRGLAWVFGGLLLAFIALVVGFLLMLWLIHKYG